MPAFAQRCCGKDTKWRWELLKVYRSLTKPLIARALSRDGPCTAPAIEGAKRWRTACFKAAARRFSRVGRRTRTSSRAGDSGIRARIGCRAIRNESLHPPPAFSTSALIRQTTPTMRATEADEDRKEFGKYRRVLIAAVQKLNWRRRWDSNPRYPSGYTPLAGERLRPLGHLSARGFTMRRSL